MGSECGRGVALWVYNARVHYRCVIGVLICKHFCERLCLCFVVTVFSGTENREVKPSKTDEIDDDNWIALTYDVNIGNRDEKRVDNKDPNEEDWDEEIKQNIMYKQTIDTCQNRESKSSAIIDSFQNVINRYPPSLQAFSATACYESLVYKKSQVTCRNTRKLLSTCPNEFSIVDGQFADV